MRFEGSCLSALIATLIAILGLPAYAQEGGLAKPNLVLQQIVEGLPSDAKQAVRVADRDLQDLATRRSITAIAFP